MGPGVTYSPSWDADRYVAELSKLKQPVGKCNLAAMAGGATKYVKVQATARVCGVLLVSRQPIRFLCYADDILQILARSAHAHHPVCVCVYVCVILTRWSVWRWPTPIMSYRLRAVVTNAHRCSSVPFVKSITTLLVQFWQAATPHGRSRPMSAMATITALRLKQIPVNVKPKCARIPTHSPPLRVRHRWVRQTPKGTPWVCLRVRGKRPT
jgi:hypothetical protein